MNKHLLPLFLGIALLASSCKKDGIVQDVVNPTLNDIVVPTVFSWQTTRDVNFSIGISDARFQNQIHVVAIYLADPTSGARNITQPRTTRSNVMGKDQSTVAAFLGQLKYRSTANIAPCQAPQITKVQFAPCHNPPSTITIKRLKYVRTTPFRFPPSGM